MALFNTRLWFILGLIVLLNACGGVGKPSIKLSATPTALEDGQVVVLLAEAKGGQGSLKVEFYKGTAKIGEDTSAPYELKLALSSDTDATVVFSAKMTASNNQSAVSEPVSVSVKIDKEAPNVALEASNSKLNAAGAVTLSANATDNKGVVKVEFFKGVEKLGQDSTPEDGFSLVINLDAEHNGLLKYSAKAYDKKGNVGTSAEVVVSVDIDKTAPSISLYADKTSITSAGTATLTAEASDNKALSKVEFFKGADKIAEDSEAPYIYPLSFSADDNGTHTYSAKAYDANNNSTASSPLSITVDIDATAPTISLASDKTTLTTAGSVTLIAEASDNKGIAKVEFFKGSDKISEDTQAPYTLDLDYTSAQNGAHTYSAKVFDSSENSTPSNSVTITVDIDTASPEVSLTSDKTTLTDAGLVTLTATASDNKSVSKVEFYEGANKVADDTEAPYIYSLN